MVAEWYISSDGPCKEITLSMFPIDEEYLNNKQPEELLLMFQKKKYPQSERSTRQKKLGFKHMVYWIWDSRHSLLRLQCETVLEMSLLKDKIRLDVEPRWVFEVRRSKKSYLMFTTVVRYVYIACTQWNRGESENRAPYCMIPVLFIIVPANNLISSWTRVLEKTYEAITWLGII